MVSQCKNSVLIIDPGTRNPELGCVSWLSKKAQELGFKTSLCLPALPHLIADVQASLGLVLDHPVMTLNELKQIDLRKLAGMIILGSGASPIESLAWQDELCAWLIPLLDQPRSESLPILGICYGHQLLAHLCGATVARLWEGEKASGLRRRWITDSRLALNHQVSLIVSHRDGVLNLPKNWQSLVSQNPKKEFIGRPTADLQSELDPTSAIEAMTHMMAPWWGFQAHIEAEEQFVEQNHVESILPIPYDGHMITNQFLHFCVLHSSKVNESS